MPHKCVLAAMLASAVVPPVLLSAQTQIELNGRHGDPATQHIEEWWRERRVVFLSGKGDTPQSECEHINEEIIRAGIRTVVEIPETGANEIFFAALSWANTYFRSGTDRIEVIQGTNPRFVVTATAKSIRFRENCPFTPPPLSRLGWDRTDRLCPSWAARGYVLTVETRDGRARITVGSPSIFSPGSSRGGYRESSATGRANVRTEVGSIGADGEIIGGVYRAVTNPGGWEWAEDTHENSTCMARGYWKHPWELTNEAREALADLSDLPTFGRNWTFEDAYVLEYAEVIGRITQAIWDAVVW